MQLIEYRRNYKVKNLRFDTLDTKTMLHVVQVGERLSSDGVISSFLGYPPFSLYGKISWLKN